MSEKTKILFDGNCIVCDTEIAHYKRIAPDKFDLVDISATDFNAAKYGLSSQAVTQQMHVFTPDGELKVGVDAFIHIWSRLKRYRLAAQVVGNPLVKPAARLGYRAFASIRHLLPKKNVQKEK